MRPVAIALLLAIAGPAAAQSAGPVSAAAAIAAPDRPADDVKLDAGRRPADLLAFMGVKPGDRVLDVLSETGYYARLIAPMVGPKGAVVGTNPPSLAQRFAPQWQAISARYPNATQRIVGASDTPPMADSSFDKVLIHLNYHDFYWESEKFQVARQDPDMIVAGLYRALKPGGSVTVVDHVAAPGGDTRAVVDQLHRIDPEVIKADFARARFKLEAESALWRNPADDHTKNVFDPAIRGRTDRVAFRFVKPR